MRDSFRECLSALAVALLLTVVAVPCTGGDAVPETASWPEGETFVARVAEKTVTLTGFTRPRSEMEIVSEATGRCLEVTADVGEPIPDGGVFARLDPTFIQLDIKSNRVERERLRDRIAYLERELVRTRSLASRSMVSERELDQSEHELTQARHELRSLQTQAEELEERLERHTIRAPAGWRLTERSVEPGQWIDVGNRLGRAADFRKLLVPLAFDPEEFEWLRDHRDSLILAAPDRNVRMEGKIERIDPAFDSTTRKINVDLQVNEGLAEHRGGIRLELQVELPDPLGAVLVPDDALLRRHAESWLLREDGAKVKVIELGRPGPDVVRVVSPDVRPGDRFLRRADQRE